MRVITGSARGCILKSLSGEDTRPTTDRVKEALFSSIQFDIDGRRILDLFAGSGQLGIECLSRGAESAVFVDSNPAAVAVIEENLRLTGLSENSTLSNKDACSFLLTSAEVYDIVFLDPPYSSDYIDKILPMLSERVSPFGIIICEHSYGKTMPSSFDGFSLAKDGKYGKIGLTIYRREYK